MRFEARSECATSELDICVVSIAAPVASPINHSDGGLETTRPICTRSTFIRHRDCVLQSMPAAHTPAIQNNMHRFIIGHYWDAAMHKPPPISTCLIQPADHILFYPVSAHEGRVRFIYTTSGPNSSYYTRISVSGVTGLKLHAIYQSNHRPHC